MKKILLMFYFCAGFVGFSVDSNAQLATVCVNCSNIWTQLVQYGVELESGAKQALQLENSILQYEAMLRNLEQNPLGYTLPDLMLLVTNAQKIEQNGMYLTKHLSDITKNAANSLRNPQLSDSMQFSAWTISAKVFQTGAMAQAAVQLEQLQSTDKDKQLRLGQAAQAANGNLAELQAIAALLGEQLNEMSKLRQLIIQQQIATGNALVTEQNKGQMRQSNEDRMTLTAVPMIDNGLQYASTFVVRSGPPEFIHIGR